MDNVTHTLIGLIVGETAAAKGREGGLPADTRRTAVLAVALVGSNAPDLDLLVSLRPSAHRYLDYVLWHRGYTHTVLGCLALVLLLYACTELVLYLKRLAPSREDRLLLFGTAAIATALHLAMDYLNSYGVHAFWPVDAGWQYGDRVFIIEPLYWAAAAPLFLLLRAALSRLLFGFAMIGVIAMGLVTHMMSGFSCVVLGSAFIGLAALGSRLRPAHAARLSLLLALAVTAAFCWAGRDARGIAESLRATYFPHDRLLDPVLTPQPANPLCWDLLLLTTRGEDYIALHAVLSLTPRVLEADRCALARPETHTAPMTPVLAPDTASVHWIGQMTLSRSLLARAVAADCDAAAFMLFARAPFLASRAATASPRVGTGTGTGPTSVLGDLRFDRGGESEQFQVPLAAPSSESGAPACRRAAPWDAPRADLFQR